jgi:hypothetical protein
MVHASTWGGAEFNVDSGPEGAHGLHGLNVYHEQVDSLVSKGKKNTKKLENFYLFLNFTELLLVSEID